MIIDNVVVRHKTRGNVENDFITDIEVGQTIVSDSQLGACCKGRITPLPQTQ